MAATSNNLWFVAQLRPQGLARAQTHLQRQKIESFSPQVLTTVTRAGVLREARADGGTGGAEQGVGGMRTGEPSQHEAEQEREEAMMQEQRLREQNARYPAGTYQQRGFEQRGLGEQRGMPAMQPAVRGPAVQPAVQRGGYAATPQAEYHRLRRAGMVGPQNPGYPSFARQGGLPPQGRYPQQGGFPPYQGVPYQGAPYRGAPDPMGGNMMPGLGAQYRRGPGRYEPQLYGPMEGGPMRGYMQDPMGRPM